MAEYIDRAEAGAIVIIAKNGEDALTALARLPAADVAPVVHGHWQRGEFGSFDCSACGMWCEDEGQTIVYPYCPNCGARMDERSEDE